MSLHHARLRAQHGHPLHQDHTEHLETGIAHAVREIDELRAEHVRGEILAEEPHFAPALVKRTVTTTAWTTPEEKP